MIMGDKKFTGAGFAIISKDNSKVLALIKKNGIFDIPKGRADKGESPFQTACRECYEECFIQVSKNDLLSKKAYRADKLYIYVAQTNQEPKVIVNPKTKILEHVGHIWVTPSEFSKNAPKYLSRVIEKIFNDII